MSSPDERVYFRPSLPPSLPVVESTIESLISISAKQRIFIAAHADRLKLELEEELALDASTSALAAGVRGGEGGEGAGVAGMAGGAAIAPPEGEWRLNGFSLTDRAVIDFVRASPDGLSNLEYSLYQKTGFFSKLSKFFKFGTKKEDRNALNVADDLAYVLSVAEVIEINGHVLAVVSHALSTQSPKLGKPLVRELAFELVNSKHRGDQHSMYLLATVKHEQQNAASNRSANTLCVALSLYLHEPALLGQSTGAAVNVSGLDDADDVPSLDVEPGELKRILAKKGVFAASASSDFVLKPNIPMTSSRAARVATVAVERLVDASNDALTAFFENESSQFQTERAAERSILQKQLQQAKLEAEQAEAAMAARERAEEERRINAERFRNGEQPLQSAVQNSDEGDWW